MNIGVNMALLLLFQTVAFGMGILFLTHSHSELKPFLCYPVFYYKQLVHLSTLFTRPLTYVLLLPCLLLQATRPLVHLSTCLLVYSSTNLCSSVTLSFITSNLSTCLTCLLVYSHYYIYLPWNRFFCVVPLHRHQE